MRVAAAVVVALLALPALAFRPSASWLFNRVVERASARSTTTLTVEATTSTWDAAGKPVVVGESERVWLAPPAMSRRELDLEKGRVVEVRADGRFFSQQGSQAGKTSNGGFDALAEFATQPADTQRLIAVLKNLGINTEVVAYSRFDGRVAYLVGSKPWETDKPQLWLDKDLMVPLRLVTFQKDGDKTVRVDTRFLGWGSPVGGSWYPAVVEVWRADVLVRRTVTESLERNGVLSPTLFAIP